MQFYVRFREFYAQFLFANQTKFNSKIAHRAALTLSLVIVCKWH